jgi:bifunctional non-homologous end joining protein LigD
MHKSSKLSPMLATLSNSPFSDPRWIYERKLDGMRCILIKRGDKVTILSRNNIIQNNFYPELITALKKYKSDFVLDSEVVAFSGRQTSFEKLQERMHVKDPTPAIIKNVPLTVFVFDILNLNNHDVTNMPLWARKEILKTNFKFVKPLVYLPFKEKDGLKFFNEACEKKWEGIIAKESESTYIHRRSSHWLKFKCAYGQEFVIGGYTPPQGTRLKFGALLLGYYQDGELKYAGKVGTGFNSDLLILIHKKMQKLIIKKSPFSNYNNEAANIIWLKPSLICDVEFSEWTSEGRLRHPRFKGLRNDKKPKNIGREAL